MELAIKILSALILIIPLIWVIYERWFSKKAAERKRRAREDEEAHKSREDAQKATQEDMDAHHKQTEAEAKWLENQKQ